MGQQSCVAAGADLYGQACAAHAAAVALKASDTASKMVNKIRRIGA